MKRIGCLLLTLCCFVSVMGASAAEKPPIRYVNEELGQWLREQELPRQEIDLPRDGVWSPEDELPDILLTDSSSFDLDLFKATGELADLSSSPAVTAAVSRMLPQVRAWITTHSSSAASIPRIVAYPIIVMYTPVYWNEQAWQAAGFSPEDAPQSYIALLDFLDHWVGRVSAKPEKAVCVFRLKGWNTGDKRFNDSYWLMDILLDAWEAQQRMAGQTVCFDDPAFIALTERTLTTGEALYQVSPSASQRENMQPLLTHIRGGSDLYNASQGSGFSHHIPLRIDASQPDGIDGWMMFYIIRQDSPWQKELLACLEAKMNNSIRYNIMADAAPGRSMGSEVTQAYLDDLSAWQGTAAFYPPQHDRVKEMEGLMMRLFRKEITAKDFARMLDQQLP